MEELDLPGVLLPVCDALPAVFSGSQSVDRLVERAPESNVHCQIVQLLQSVNAAHLVDQRPKVSFLSLGGHAVRVILRCNSCKSDSGATEAQTSVLLLVRQAARSPVNRVVRQADRQRSS